MIPFLLIKFEIVAPHVGAWIETVMQRLKQAGIKSHPTWVRGLKPEIILPTSAGGTSHPTWVRGLKPTPPMVFSLKCVAPHVGAWIETFLKLYIYG